MTLDDSALTVGGSLAGVGSVTAVQGSTVSVTSTSPWEVIYLRSSLLNVLGPTANFLSPVVMEDGSEIDLSGSNTVAVGQNFSVYSTGPIYPTLPVEPGGDVVNKGVVNVAGNMLLDANLVQTVGDAYYNIGVENGGHLTLTGSTDGGTIAITSGTIEFFASPSTYSRAGSGSRDCVRAIFFVVIISGDRWNA